MSLALERQLIETTYKAGMPVGVAIQYENVPFTVPAGGYTRISVRSGGEGRRTEITATSNARTSGIVDVSIFVPPDTGTANLRATADAVESALANKTLSSGTTTIRTYGASFDIIGKQGAWFQGNVTIRYERDTR